MDDGKILYQATGDRMFYFEHELENLLLSPVPDVTKLDPANVEVEKDELKVGKAKLSCANVKARLNPDGETPKHPGVPAGDYCFDPSTPVLRIVRLFNSVVVGFDNLAKTQNRILSREIEISDGRHKLLTFTVETTLDLKKDDAALAPPADARPVTRQNLPSSSAQGRLAKKAFPVYPPAAKESRITGTVILDAMIGTDGRVKDIRVLGTPSPILTTAAKEAVLQWQYSPYVVDGQSQEVNTIINVVFAISY